MATRVVEDDRSSAPTSSDAVSKTTQALKATEMPTEGSRARTAVCGDATLALDSLIVVMRG